MEVVLSRWPLLYFESFCLLSNAKRRRIRVDDYVKKHLDELVIVRVAADIEANWKPANALLKYVKWRPSTSN